MLSRNVKAKALAAILASSASSLAQAPPILNSPYVCANGITYTVTVCKPFGADQWCETDEKQNGNLVTGMNSAWSSMTGRLKGCSNAGSSSGNSQNLNPAYLSELPTPDQVMAKMKGTTAQDTANRQMGAFEQLQQIVKDIAGPRAMKGQLTADESRILGNYALAYDNLAKPLHYPDDGYFANPDFVQTLFNTFSMPTVLQQWQAQNAALAKRVKPQPPSSGGNGTDTTDAPRPLPPTNDPSQIAIRRCFELGGTGLTCVGAALNQGTMVMMGMYPSSVPNRGLVFLGNFTAAGGPGFAFTNSSVDIGPCGVMVKGDHNYTVTASAGKYLINIANQPQPIVVTIGPDRKGSGPASQDVAGQKVTMYEVTKNIKTGAVVGTTPFYGPVTAKCNFGTLTPGPDVAVNSGVNSGDTGVDASLFSALGSVINTMAGNASKPYTVPAGPRMGGVYKSAGGLSIQFNDGSAIVECGQAHVLALYDVSSQGGQITVAVKNGTNPFSLTVKSDGSLSGPATVTLSGKTMTALAGANPVFAQANASCPLNALTPAK